MKKRLIIPDALWRANLSRDIEKLRLEVAGHPSRRRVLGAGLAALVAEFVDLNRSKAMSIHGGGAPLSVNAITNARTGATYQYLPQAIYDPAVAANDTILIPAGINAPAYPSTPYSDYRMLNSHHWGYSATFANMYIYAPLSFVGVGTSSNGRAVFSRPYSTLASDYHNGDTVMNLVDASSFAPTNDAEFILPWGDGSAVSYASCFGVYMNYTGVNYNTNQLTGVTCSRVTPTLPAGSMIIAQVVNRQGLFNAYAPNPGLAFTNMEIWGATEATDGGTAAAGSVRQSTPDAGAPAAGSITFNNCYLHDATQGIGLGFSYPGLGVFAHFFQTEVFRNGFANGRTHNIYIDAIDELIFDGSYSHHTGGTHLIKSRAFSNYFTYSRITGERTDPDPRQIQGANLDISNGGLTYIIGCQFEQSLHTSNWMVQYNPENNTSTVFNAANATQELYATFNTVVAPDPATGHAWNAPFILFTLGITNPELPKLASVSTPPTRLPARTYIVQNTVTASGNESQASFIASGEIVEIINVPATKLLQVASPAPRTGATGYNTYVNYADPILYQYPYRQNPVEVGNIWFWDAAHTQPVFSEAPGGSLPQTYLLFGFTYQFPTGESANLALLGQSFYGLGPGGTPGYFMGDYTNPAVPSTLWAACTFQQDKNNFVTVNPPPSVAGATGWNLYAVAVTFSGEGSYGAVPMSKQNGAPIAFGTPFVQSGAWSTTSPVSQPNMFKQNGGTPLTIGTPWTEPTSGIVSGALPPRVSTITTGSPIGLVDNNISANFYPNNPQHSNGWLVKSDGTSPSGFVTLGTHNIQSNVWNGSSFQAPLWANVFDDPTQSDYDYRLKSGSVAIGAGTDPGSSPEGYKLTPVYQLELFGSPAPGSPVPAKTPRRNTGSSFDAGGLEFGT